VCVLHVDFAATQPVNVLRDPPTFGIVELRAWTAGTAPARDSLWYPLSPGRRRRNSRIRAL
jgi:hypothetical protein